jgi:hypothetical protein
MSPTEACTTMTSTFGAASRNSIGVIGASMSCRVRRSNCGDAACGAASSCGNVASFGKVLPPPIAFSAMTNFPTAPT